MVIYTTRATKLSQIDYTCGLARLKKKNTILYRKIRSLELKNFVLAKQQLLNSR